MTATSKKSKKTMSKVQLSKLQPTRLPIDVQLAGWIGGHCNAMQGVSQTLSSATSTTRITQQSSSKVHVHTHILLNMFEPLCMLIADVIFSSSPWLARSLPSISDAFALMNY